VQVGYAEGETHLKNDGPIMAPIVDDKKMLMILTCTLDKTSLPDILRLSARLPFLARLNNEFFVPIKMCNLQSCTESRINDTSQRSTHQPEESK